MPGTENIVYPWNIVKDRTGRRVAFVDRNRKHTVIKNGCREHGRAVGFRKTVDQLDNQNISKDCDYLKECNVYRKEQVVEKSYTMSSLNRDQIYNDSHTDYGPQMLNNDVLDKPIFQREEQQQQYLQPIDNLKNPTNDQNEPNKITTLNIFPKNSIQSSENITLTLCQRKRKLHLKKLFFYLVRFVTGYNITCLRVLLFVFFIGTAFVKNGSPGDSMSPSTWPFPGADAKAVMRQNKNVLILDTDRQHTPWIEEVEPPSDYTQDDNSFNDFPDINTDTEPPRKSSKKSPGQKRSTSDGSDTVVDAADEDVDSEGGFNEDEEYEAYDDSPGEKSRGDKKDSDNKMSEKQANTISKHRDNRYEYSDEGDDVIADNEDEDEEEDDDWVGDMSSQPLFVPPGMNVNSDAVGMETTGKDSTEGDTTNKSDDKPPNREIPEYMLKLYQKFTQKHYSHPASDTVRSFSNINDDIMFNISNGKELPGAKTRNHTLAFNISSFPRGEQINLAQLRLYKLVERDRNTYVGDDRKVSLYEVITDDDGTRHLKLVSQKHIYGRNSGWESFDVTPAVRRWVDEIETGAVQVLEVTIESIFNSMWGGDVDISIEPRNKKEPLLVVFSKQINKRLVHQHERDELLQHDMTLSDIEDVDNYTTTEPPPSSSPVPSSRASARSRSDQSDVDGQDDADDDNDDDSRDDPYGSLDEMTSYAKVTQSMRTGKEYQSRSKQKIRVKRSKSSSKRNICRRTKLEVDFNDIQGHGWIVAPKKYQAFECSGKCYFPLGDHLRPTKHAIIRANLYVQDRKSVV